MLRRIKFYMKRSWNSPTLMTLGNMVSSSVKLLVLTPLILTKYNINEIAFWYLLLTINSFAIVIDFGFYPTFSRAVSFAFHGLESLENIDDRRKPSNGLPNWNLMQKIYGTINSTYLFLSFGVVIIIFALTYSPVKHVIDKTNDQPQLWLAYILYALSVLASFFSKKFDSVIIGTNNIVLINRWDIINNALNTLVSIVIVYFGCKLYVLALNQLLFSLILLIRDYYLERSICDGKFKQFKFFAYFKDVFYWCWGPIWKSGILILCSTGINQASGLIYSGVSDTASLAAYLLTLKLVTTIAQFSQAPFYSKLPQFSGSRVKNDMPGLINSSASSMMKALFVFVIGILVLIFAGDWILIEIHSKARLINYQIIMFMGLVWFLERNHAMHAQVYVTTNKIPFYKSAIVSGIINLGLIVLLLPKIGLWAFPLAQGISNLLINNWWNVMLSITSMKVSYREYITKSALYPLLLLIFFYCIRIFI